MHFSAQAAVLMAVLGFGLFAIFLHHSWRYDRWNSLKLWHLASSREVFKVLMTYGFAIGLPCFGACGVITAKIKYEVGFLPLEMGGLPVPWQLWNDEQRSWLKPLQVLTAVTWFLDLTVHHQELSFWLWLLKSKPGSKPWFSSFWFHFFLFGMVGYAGGLVAVSVVSFNDPVKNECYIDLFYASSTIFESAVFGWVFWVFPSFVRSAKMEGGTADVLGRLLQFHEINKLRIATRIVFGLALFVLGIDGLTVNKKVNKNLAAMDTLIFVAVVGNIISAFLTMMVFMPRSVLKEHNMESRMTLPTVSVERVKQFEGQAGSDYSGTDAPSAVIQVARAPARPPRPSHSLHMPTLPYAAAPPGTEFEEFGPGSTEDYKSADDASSLYHNQGSWGRERGSTITVPFTGLTEPTHRNTPGGEPTAGGDQVPKKTERPRPKNPPPVPGDVARAASRRWARSNPAISNYTSPFDIPEGQPYYSADVIEDYSRQ